MKAIKYFIDKRKADPYVDRRSGENRRQVYDTDYWDSGGIERRNAKDRRHQKERRDSFIKVSKWSSVSINDKADQVCLRINYK